MATKDIQKKTDAELEKLVHEKREELRTVRFQSAGSGTRDAKAIRGPKKEIARALTALNTRESKESKE